MVIEIDDTAWGIVAFGVWLGFHRIETGKIVVKEVPVEFFQGDNFTSHAYLGEGLKRTKDALFRDLRLKDGEEIRICSGYVLSEIYDWLHSRGFNCKKSKIKETLQKVMERTSREAISSLPDFSKEPSEPLYDALIRWVSEKPRDRIKYTKTGWKPIQKIMNRMEKV